MSMGVNGLGAGRKGRRALLAGTALAAPLALFAVGVAPPAMAACNQTGNNVSCTDTSFNYASGAQTNLNVVVQPGATVIGTGGNDAIRITNSSGITGNTLTNNGTIDGFVTILSINPGTDTFTNNGVLKITDPNANIQEHSMAGTNFIQTANGIFLARVDANGFYDGILSRTANLNGRLVVVVTPGIYTTVNTFNSLINTSAGLTGNFSSVTSSSPFFSVTTAVVGNDLDVTLTRIGFNAVSGLTPNQQAVGNALEPGYSETLDPASIPGRIYSNLLAATSTQALDVLSGQGLAAAQNAAFGAGAQFSNSMVMQGLNGGSGVFLAPAAYAAEPAPRGHEAFAALKARPAAQTGGWRIWTSAFGSTQRLNGEGNPGSSSQRIRGGGGAFGIEHYVAPGFVAGVAVGGSASSFSVAGLAVSGTTHGGHLGAYAVVNRGPFYAAGSVSYARFETDTTRTITGIGPSEVASASFGTDQIGGRLELGWTQAYGRHVVKPFVAIEPAVIRQQGFTETTNGILGLNVAAETTTSLPASAGIMLETKTALANGATLSPYARVAWVHEFNPDRTISASFISLPEAAFTVGGARPARDAIRLDGGAKFDLPNGMALFANLTGEFSDRSTGYGATGGIRATW